MWSAEKYPSPAWNIEKPSNLFLYRLSYSGSSYIADTIALSVPRPIRLNVTTELQQVAGSI
jgi:hypothetical protein